MASNSMALLTTAEFWCKKCNIPFKTDGAFKIHKVNSDRHICCDVCGADFKSEEGKKRHRAAHHAEEQDLTCKFCGLTYPRVGSLINHYEESQCKQVSSDSFKQAIRDTLVRDTAQRQAHKFKDIRRSGNFSGQGQEPLPPFLDASNSLPDPGNSNNGSAEAQGWLPGTQTIVDSSTQGAGLGYQKNGAYRSSGVSSGHGGWQNGYEIAPNSQAGGWPTSPPTHDTEAPLIDIIPEVPVSEDEDLIHFDTPSAVLNSSWSIPASDVLKNAQKYSRVGEVASSQINVRSSFSSRQTSIQATQGSTQGKSPAPSSRGPPHTWGKMPAVNSTPNPTPTPTQGGVWGQKNLFPSALSPVAPPVDLLSSLNISAAATPATRYRKFDPGDPSFDANRFYVQIIGKWKCPHSGCNGSFKTKNSFVGHLKSPAHSEEKFQCLKCLRYYDSMTALAQHSEAQGIRCNVRDTDDFNSVVRAITADTTIANGRMADDTVRYEINPDAELTKNKMADNYRAAQKVRNDSRARYWDNHNVKW